MITSTELLNFLCKAHKLSVNPRIIQNDAGYKINLYYDWYDEGRSHSYEVFITNEGESTWNTGDYDFYTMDRILDEKLEEEEQKKIKAQKRKELIARMSDEDKELLGLK